MKSAPNSLILLMMVLLTGSLVSCKKEKEKLAIPSSYDGSSFSTNAAEELDLRSRLAALTTLMKTGRNAGITVANADLIALFEAGTPSLKSEASAYYQNLVPVYLSELAAASAGTYDPLLPVSGEGGTYGGTSKYLFNEHGLEMEQMVEKGLFSAAFYNRAKKLLTEGTPDLVKLDKALALYGAHPDFANSNDAGKHANPDGLAAGYAARRDDNTGNGLYLTIKKNFITAQAAIKAGSEFNELREQAIRELLENWERAVMATTINYCYEAIEGLAVTSPDDASRAGALHEISEAAAFVNGFRGIGGKLATDNQLDAILAALRAPVTGDSELARFVLNPVAGVSELQSVIQQIGSVYGFSESQIESFERNFVAEQGR
jgi:hypothetical protein